MAKTDEKELAARDSAREIYVRETKIWCGWTPELDRRGQVKAHPLERYVPGPDSDILETRVVLYVPACGDWGGRG